MKAALAALALTVLVAAGMQQLAARPPSHAPRSKDPRACTLRVTYPRKVDCPDRHGYLWQDGAWYDLGELRLGALARGTPAR